KQNEKGTLKMGNNEYGCADAANILYTLGALERDVYKRSQLIKALQDFQHVDGLFDEGTHHPIHCTAHCTAALELFDAAPLLPFTALDTYKNEEELLKMLEYLPWVENPWPAAHEGAGIYAAFILTKNATTKWQDAYFDWLTSHADPVYGIGLEGAIAAKVRPISHHLNGWFHYLFNFVFAHRPIPYAKQAVDTCIDLYKKKTDLVKNFGRSIGFAEIDWVYVIHRASAQEGYRVEEVKSLLRDFAKGYFEYLFSLDYDNNDSWNDLHLLFGTTCAIAELQIALPGEFKTDYPLKLVLDRRPFI
ncbi:MAG: hypothetical protein GX661_03890, partial [Acholeplasmataceae bacterium]|nr:hypothetical protein [Acholeplasmataceae bacterium]